MNAFFRNDTPFSETMRHDEQPNALFLFLVQQKQSVTDFTKSLYFFTNF